MKKEILEAIQFKIEQEKQQVSAELALLLQKKAQNECQIAHEEAVLFSRERGIGAGRVMRAGALQLHGFSKKKFDQLQKEAEQLKRYIRQNEAILLQLDETEREALKLYQTEAAVYMRQEEKKVEQDRLDMQLILNK
ncbi:hypothetical protein [Listeria costaricensis]|uniref:hypothetical protein n=1 Tax=Listeria costaricensis TaxID=2026604 RepID=UPI000C0763C9|nr:hypothetical protein [Listeria costaricensis]